MGGHDLDPYDSYDPDYGDDARALWGERDDWELGSDFDAGSDYDADGVIPQHYLEPLELARPSTIRRYNEAMDLGVQRIRSMRAQQRAAAVLQSYALEDTFLGNGLRPTPHAPSPASPAGVDGRDTCVRTWLQSRTPLLTTLRDLTLWVRGAGIAALPASELGAIYHLAWNLFCATLRFPRTRSAFETFAANPVASPEVARFRLSGVGPCGPPPPAQGPHFVARWGIEHLQLSSDDVI